MHLLTSEKKYGRPNDKTPAKWNTEYKDFHGPAGYPNAEGNSATPANQNAEKIRDEMASHPDARDQASRSEVLDAPAVPPIETAASDDEADAGAENGTNGAAPASNKKKRKHEGETPEEREARKRRKEEKRAKKEAKKSKA